MSEEEIASDGQLEIINAYLNVLKEHQRLPSYSDFHNEGISKGKIKHHFINLNNLHDEMMGNYGVVISQYIAHESHLFSEKKFAQLSRDIKKFKRFIIVTAVSEKNVSEPFFNALKSYSTIKKAKRIILPCADRTNRRKRKAWSFDPLLKDESFIFQDTKLNSNLFLSSILLSAKHINPTTGLSRIGQRHGSYIFASPKQSLEYVMGSMNHEKMPHAMMTTGALTVADYETDRYMSERTSYIAENDHVIGALIVEIANDDMFHFRQIQAADDGSFIDMGIQYNPDGTTEAVETNIVLGDWHSGNTDPIAIEATARLCKELNVKNLILHDFFDGESVNHHIVGYPLKQTARADSSRHILLDEIIKGGEDINYLHSLISGDLVMVKGNHDEFLERYLDHGTFMGDHVNQKLSIELAAQRLNGVPPLPYAYLKYGNINHPERIIWLERDDSYQIGGVELGVHGDLGFNGSRASLASLERAYGVGTFGHNHGAAILRQAWRVGTTTRLRLPYVRGPSTWTWTHCLQYQTGARQLINIIQVNNIKTTKGEYRI